MSLHPKFENTEVNIEELPDIGALNLLPLDTNYKNVRVIVWLIFALIIVVAFISVMNLVPWQGNRHIFVMIAAPILTLILVFSFIVTYFGYFKMAFALREKDIYYKKGLIFRKTTIIPFNRIQHCEVNHGPVDRMFGLASLKIFTAGGQASDLEIPGLKESKAHTIKDYIIGKTGLDEEE